MSEPRISKETVGNSWGILLKRHFGSQVGLSSSESLKHGHRVYWMKLTSYLQQMWVSVSEWVSTRSIISVYDISTQEVSSCTVTRNWTRSRDDRGRWQSDHTCCLPHRFSELATLKKWNGPEAQTGMYQWSTSIDLQKLPVGVQAAQYLPEWREKTKQIDWWAKQPSQVAWFLEDLLSVEELETLPAGTKPRMSHHQSPGWRSEPRKEEVQQDNLLCWKGQERAIINQANIGTISKAMLGKLLRLDGVAGAHNLWAFLSA